MGAFCINFADSPDKLKFRMKTLEKIIQSQNVHKSEMLPLGKIRSSQR